MRGLSSRPFCHCDSRRGSLGYLSAGCRYTTHYSKKPKVDDAVIEAKEQAKKYPPTAQAAGGLHCLYSTDIIRKINRLDDRKVGKREKTKSKNRPLVRHGHVYMVLYGLTERCALDGTTG